MIEVQFHRTFTKQYRKLSVTDRKRFSERLDLWLEDASDPRLRVHPLKGTRTGYWSMNVSGDLRALYRYEDEMIVLFSFIGTHSQLYGK